MQLSKESLHEFQQPKLALRWFVFVFDSFLCYYTTIISCNKPFASKNWHQKEPFGRVVYSHCPTYDSYNNSIHSCCLPWYYVTKPFGILRRVIKSQRVHISDKNFKLLSTIYFFHGMIAHDKGLDTKEKLKLTFDSYLIIKTSFQKNSVHGHKVKVTN